MTSEFLTAEEIAEYLKVDIMTIYRLAKEGKIPASKVGHQWRFNKKEVDVWFKNGHLNTNSNSKT